MFRNRALTITVDKKNKNADVETSEHESFESKTEVVAELFEKKSASMLRKLEKTGVKVFAGICIYVLLDTYRQVQVAQATNNPKD